VKVASTVRERGRRATPQGATAPYSVHMIPRHLGGDDRLLNLQLLHRHCHDQKTAQDGSNQARTGQGIPDKDHLIEEPCAAKVASTVCAVRRVLIFPPQAGGTRETFLGHQSTQRRKPKVDKSRLGKRGLLESVVG
jgi:hypothetical protein